MKPTPPPELLKLVVRHKAEILAALTGSKAKTKLELPGLVWWRMGSGGVYGDGWRFLRMGQARAGETFAPIVLSTMPRREERFRIPYGATAWKLAGETEWRNLNELPKQWRK